MRATRAPLRVLVVGAGFMGSLHARTVQGARRGVLCGVVDRSEPVAQAVGDELGVSAYTDLRQAIEETRPDAAVIATPDRAHRAPTETALETGLSVLVEKPLATTVDDAEAIAALARRRGARLMPGHLLRFDLRYAQLADAVRGGRLGRPVVVSAARWGRRSLGARVGEVTTPLWHFLIHDVDAVQWVTGGRIAQVDGAVQVESGSVLRAFTATGSLDTGASFQLAAGWTLPEGSLSPHVTFEVHGELAHANLAAGEDGLVLAGEDRADRCDGSGWPTVRGRVEGALRREIEHFLSAVMDGSPFVVTPEEAVDAVRSAAALERTAVTRRLP